MKFSLNPFIMCNLAILVCTILALVFGLEEGRSQKNAEVSQNKKIAIQEPKAVGPSHINASANELGLGHHGSARSHKPHSTLTKRVSSFAEPELQETYSYLFSLIGSHAESNGFKNSGYDTDENASTAYLSLRLRDYSNTSKSALEASFFALEHLLRSDLRSAGEYRRQLTAHFLKEIAENSDQSALEKSLMGLDLRSLLESNSYNLESLQELYDREDHPKIRQSLQFAIIRKLEKEGVDHAELGERLERLGVEAPQMDYAALKPVERKKK